MKQIKQELFNRKMPSIMADLGATSNCGQSSNPVVCTSIPFAKIFQMPLGQKAQTSKQANLLQPMKEPAQTVDIVPELQQNSLLSISKFVDANNFTKLMPDEVNFSMETKQHSPAHKNQ